ncbi:MAG: flotillin-like protein FloA [Pirellulaceae bacterium]
MPLEILFVSQIPFQPVLVTVGLGVVILLLAVVALALLYHGALWFQAYVSGADISLMSLIGMSFREVDPALIVTAKIMGVQAGLSIDPRHGMSTARLEAHHLAGGDLMGVMKAIIAAHRAEIDLDFDRAAAIDLAGRDVLDAVRTSVFPKVIFCPQPRPGQASKISTVAQNGVELLVQARVTVRTNLNQLVGGATEETIIARVCQGIVTVIGSTATHMEVLERPALMSQGVMNHGLDANTAFTIVSIDISDVDVGENIGARLQTEQADADTRMALAKAEVRRTMAVAYEQEMTAKISHFQAELIQSEAQIPIAVAEAFRGDSKAMPKRPAGSEPHALMARRMTPSRLRRKSNRL